MSVLKQAVLRFDKMSNLSKCFVVFFVLCLIIYIDYTVTLFGSPVNRILVLGVTSMLIVITFSLTTTSPPQKNDEIATKNNQKKEIQQRLLTLLEHYRRQQKDAFQINSSSFPQTKTKTKVTFTIKDIPYGDCAIVVNTFYQRSYIIPNIIPGTEHTPQLPKSMDKNCLEDTANAMKNKGLTPLILKQEQPSAISNGYFKPIIRYVHTKQFSTPIHFPENLFNLN